MRRLFVDCSGFWVFLGGKACVLKNKKNIHLSQIDVSIFHHRRSLVFGPTILATRLYCYDNTIVNFTLDVQSVHRPYIRG